MSNAEHELNLSSLFNPGASMQRVSQSNPTFVELKTGDPIPDQLRQALNVTAFVRDLRQIAIKRIQEEGNREILLPTS